MCRGSETVSSPGSSGTGSDEAGEATDGYLILGEEVWDPVEDLDYLPEAWIRTRKHDRVPDSKKADRFPQRLHFDEFGRCSETEPMKYWGWFMKAPLLFDRRVESSSRPGRTRVQSSQS